VGYLFRTPPEVHLLATGPLNAPKDGIAALTGIVETDWLPFPFTMNWRMTRPGTVHFEKDEPFCLIIPVRAGILEPIVPKLRELSDEPDLSRRYQALRDSRASFNAKLQQGIRRLDSDPIFDRKPRKDESAR
jgi:hypothetical protein